MPYIILAVAIILFIVTYVINKSIPTPPIDPKELPEKCQGCLMDCRMKSDSKEGGNCERQ